MLKKVSLALSVIAVLGFAVATSPAFAKPQGGKTVHANKSVNVNRNVNVNRAVSGRFVVGQRYNGHMWYGHNRHFWYGYGVGPCWINVDGEWFWNELVCPL